MKKQKCILNGTTRYALYTLDMKRRWFVRGRRHKSCYSMKELCWNILSGKPPLKVTVWICLGFITTCRSLQWRLSSAIKSSIQNMPFFVGREERLETNAFEIAIALKIVSEFIKHKIIHVQIPFKLLQNLVRCVNLIISGTFTFSFFFSCSDQRIMSLLIEFNGSIKSGT